MSEVSTITKECLVEKLSVLKEILRQEWPLLTLGAAVCLWTGNYVAHEVKCRGVKARIIKRQKRTEDNLKKLQRALFGMESAKRANANSDRIVQMSFHQLQGALQEGQLTAVQVLEAYQAKMMEVNEQVNAVTDVIMDAKDMAMSIDAKDATSRGPLHGMPISLKESFGIKGEDCTSGFALLIDNPLPDDSVLVKVLKKLGAVPYVRTNLPQGMRSYATDNPIYGLTVNPFNAERSSGGSSGGEGALVGGGGSILGVGSDIAGSIRIPASFCGIVGFKPTASRLSYLGNFGYGTRLGGQTLVPPAIGPMTRDVEASVTFMRAMLGSEMFDLDPTTPPIPFNDQEFRDSRPLRIGYYTYDGCTKCVPAMVRAVHETRDRLQAMGHTLIEFEPQEVNYAMDELLFPALFGDELASYRDLVQHDNTCDIMHDWVSLCRYPYFVRWIIGAWKSLTSNDPQNAALIKRPVVRNVSEWFAKARQSNAYKASFLRHWKSQNLDLVLCPSFPSVAVKNGLDRRQLVAVTYTALYNVLNYPAGTLPVTKVTQDDVDKIKDCSPQTEVEKQIHKDSEDSQGMPVCVQLVGLPFREEMVLRVMAQIEQDVNDRKAKMLKKI